MTRDEYGEIYHRVLASRQGVKRVAKAGMLAQQDGMSVLVLHPSGASLPPAQATDYYILVSHGSLMFRAPVLTCCRRCLKCG